MRDMFVSSAMVMTSPVVAEMRSLLEPSLTGVPRRLDRALCSLEARVLFRRRIGETLGVPLPFATPEKIMDRARYPR